MENSVLNKNPPASKSNIGIYQDHELGHGRYVLSDCQRSSQYKEATSCKQENDGEWSKTVTFSAEGEENSQPGCHLSLLWWWLKCCQGSTDFYLSNQ